MLDPLQDRRILLLAVVCLGFGFSAIASASPEGSAAGDTVVVAWEQEYLLIPAGIQPVQLAHRFIDPQSVRLFVDGLLWERGQDYRVRGRSGIVVALRDWATAGQAAADSSLQSQPSAMALVMVSYAFVPVPIAARLDLRPVSPAPALGAASAREIASLSGEDAAGGSTGNLVVSGSKSVQVASGSRREMTVDQNLRLTITGQLTQDIAVRAFLSDDNLPVVPEGNTEELRDIDKVFVEMLAPHWRTTLGDFVAQRQGTTFGNYRRKLQGVSMEVFKPGFGIEGLAGSPRGLYRTLQIRGQESNQGPYYLASAGSGQNLFIVADSEKVRLDGELLTRGSDRDYTIDYVQGTVTFTYRRLITAESTIVIEYEEGEGPYGRTVLGGGGHADFELPLTGFSARLGARMIRERDDPTRLRTGELGPQDEAILRSAGDDPDLAVASGVTMTEPGQGLYDEVDAEGKIIYVYNPEGGDFDVAYFYVGPGLGDYALDQLTEAGITIFRHTGEDLGAYRPGRPLALPESQSIVTLSAALGDSQSAGLNGEWNLGVYDRNVLSGLDGGDNQGTAARLSAQTGIRELSWGETSLGRFAVHARYEDRSAEFKPFQVHKTIFSYDGWGLGSRSRQKGFLDQSDRETELGANWQTGQEKRLLALEGHRGFLRHGSSLSAERTSGQARWAWLGGRGRHLVQEATASDLADTLDIIRIQRRHEVSWALGPVTPSLTYGQESWADDAVRSDLARGFGFEEIAAGLEATGGKPFGWRVEFKRGLADSLHQDTWELKRDSRTWRAGLTTGSLAGLRLVGEGTLRRILQSDGPEQTTRLGRLNLSGQWDAVGSDWSLGYRLENSRTEVLDGQVVFVGENQGDFSEDGTYLGPDQGDYNFIQVGTDSLVATTAVQADLHWRQKFAFLGKDRWYGAWSTLTIGSVSGRSTTDDISGLLRLDPAVIFDRQTTVLGDAKLSQEWTLLQHLKWIDFRGKFDFQQARDRQFATHPEDRINRSWQASCNLSVSARSSLRLRWQQQDERRYTSETSASVRRSFVALTRRYELGWNVRPKPDLRVGIQAEYLTRIDRISLVRQQEYALRPTSRQRIGRAWTLQVEVRLAEVVSEEPVGVVRPWFFPLPGRNVDSSLRLAWEPTRYLTVAGSWFARKQGDRRWQHDVRIESTARF